MFDPESPFLRDWICSDFSVAWADQNIFLFIDRSLLRLDLPCKKCIIGIKFLLFINTKINVILFTKEGIILLESLVLKNFPQISETAGDKNGRSSILVSA